MFLYELVDGVKAQTPQSCWLQFPKKKDFEGGAKNINFISSGFNIDRRRVQQTTVATLQGFETAAIHQTSLAFIQLDCLSCESSDE